VTSAEQPPDVLLQRPKRADARRNYDALIAAARDAFAEHGTVASLEDIARRARVGIGTLYRHFPTRQDLFEAVYVNEVDALCRSADDFTDLPPWDALVAWLHRFVIYTNTKRALAEALNYDSEMMRACRATIYSVGEPLLQRAQAAGAARADISFDDLMRFVIGITMMQSPDSEQLERVLGMGLDGLRAGPRRKRGG
jgi:AcrR family transcriptional regulator